MQGRLPNAGFLNYRGDVTKDAVGQIVGPNAFREMLIAVEATYDPEADRTRVGFDYLRKGDV